MTPPVTNRRPRWATLALTILPIWLIASAGVAVWLSIRSDRANEQEQQRRFVAEMSVERIADDLGKFTTVIGERNTSTPTAAANLQRAASMIEGILGPSNTGYQIDRIPGPSRWPILRAQLKGQKQNTAPVWVLTAYDCPRKSTGAELNASGVAASIAAAQAMAADELPASIHFIFIPHANEDTGPLQHTLETLQLMEPHPAVVICPDAMGAAKPLLAVPSHADIPAIKALTNLGFIATADQADTRAFRIICESGLPAIRLTTRPQPDPTAIADPEHTATAAGKLVEWLRRCARLTPQD